MGSRLFDGEKGFRSMTSEVNGGRGCSSDSGVERPVSKVRSGPISQIGYRSAGKRRIQKNKLKVRLHLERPTVKRIRSTTG